MADSPRHPIDGDETFDAPPISEQGALDTLADGVAGENAQAEPPPPGPGTAIGRYVALSRLGAGAMGVVLAAYDPELDRKVAIKLLKPHARTDKERARKRLQREAQVLARLNHTHVVTVHDVGVHEGSVFVAMEFVAGRTIREWLASTDSKRGPGWQAIVTIFEAAAEGLAAAHAADLIHRDFKPDNVMIGDDDRVRVLDFGLARGALAGNSDSDEPRPLPTGPAPADLTKTGDLAGTPVYMAPEQFTGAATALCDQFAFCVSLFEALYGVRPFRDRSWNDHITKSVRNEPPASAHVPSWLRAVVERGFALDPKDRYADMKGLLVALRAGDRKTRRRWLVGGTLVLLAFGSAALAIPKWSAARRDKACRETGDEIDSVWNDEIRADVASGIAATEVEYAIETTDQITSLLDAHSDSWSNARVDACRAARVEKVWDDARLRAAQWCLDDRLLELESLVTELAEADRDSIRYAADATSRLGSIEACLDPRQLGLASSPSHMRGLREIRASIWHARAQINAGRAKDGYTTAMRAIADAETLGHPELAASARLQAGWALHRDGRLEEGREVLQRAYFDAIDVSAADVQIEAATRLSFNVGLSLGRGPEGLLWSRLAESALDQLGAPKDDLRRAMMLDYRGSGFASRGMHQQATVVSEQALAIRSRLLGDQHPRVATSLNNAGAIMTYLGNHKRARRFHERALAIQERSFGIHHPDITFALGNLANIATEEGDFPAAEKLYRRALGILSAAHGEEHPSVPLTLGNLAILQLDQGRHNDARTLVERALPLAERQFGPNHNNVGALLNTLGGVEFEDGNFDASLVALERALQIYEAILAPDDPELAASIENVAEVREARGEADIAATLRKRAAAIRGGRKAPD